MTRLPRLALASCFALSGVAHAEPRNWIDRYIAAHGHCTQQPTGPYTSLNPLEKPIDEWTDDDLGKLKAALDRCDALPEEQTGVSRMWTGQFYDSFASLVHAQQAREAQREEALASETDRASQLEATRQRRATSEKQAASARLEGLKRAADQEAVDKKASEERALAVAAEEKEAVHLAEEAEARAKAAQAEARARHGVEAAKQRATEAEQLAQNAEQQASNDRSVADERFKQAHPQARSFGNGTYSNGSNMSCSDVADVFDNDDKENAVKIGITIDSLMKDADARQIANGNPSVLRVLTDAAYEKIKVLPVSYCRNNRGYTLRKATLDMFDGVKGVQSGFRK